MIKCCIFGDIQEVVEIGSFNEYLVYMNNISPQYNISPEERRTMEGLTDEDMLVGYTHITNENIDEPEVSTRRLVQSLHCALLHQQLVREIHTVEDALRFHERYNIPVPKETIIASFKEGDLVRLCFAMVMTLIDLDSLIADVGYDLAKALNVVKGGRN